MPGAVRRVKEPDRVGGRRGRRPTAAAQREDEAVAPDRSAEVVEAFRHVRANCPRVRRRVVDFHVGQPGSKSLAPAEHVDPPFHGAGLSQTAAPAHGGALAPRIGPRGILDAQAFHGVRGRTLAADGIKSGTGIGRGERGHVEGARAGQRRCLKPLVAVLGGRRKCNRAGESKQPCDAGGMGQRPPLGKC